ncbi:N/A [soil metagenome]
MRVLVDGSGGRWMGKSARKQLLETGCKLCRYHKTELRHIGRLNNRDHRKIAVIDGSIGYVGGHCVVDSWLGDAEDKNHFRDLSVRLRGPIVHDLQVTFSENWVAETGELFAGEGVFPALTQAGHVLAHVARIRPSGSSSAVKILHHLAIGFARKRLWIQNPYFIPDPEAIDMLVYAVERGVDVRIMTTALEASDMPLVQHAAHHNFDKLLAGGVRIFEYQRTLLHQKVIAVDDVWCAVGSSNFDDRSFEINDEVTVGFFDSDLTHHLMEIFERDRALCIERTLDEWQQRGVVARLRDFAYYIINEQL